MSKPREFWICNEPRGAYHYAHDEKQVKEDVVYDYHVIEKSAYDKAIEALKDLADNEKYGMKRVVWNDKAKHYLKNLGEL